ncbi:hypothetical protein [Micromonospora sp. NPDC006431]|uniref:hypothetical protein n=1 Tax=Micromonospora sp. NPDC006431 TaxID=3364235 RepID=UPI003691E808
MRFHRSVGPADRAESDRLLDASRAGRQPTADPLAHLLVAAAAPAEPGELSGEEQALAAFRAARAAPVPAPALAPRRPGRLRVGAAAWLAGLATTATAGVAFAAVSLDRPDQPAPPSAPSTSGSTGGGSAAAPTGSQGGSPTGTGIPGQAPTTGAAPTPSDGPGQPAGAGKLAGHCKAYLAKSPPQRAKALESPGFADLVAAAGGADQVEDFCLRLVPERAPKPSPAASAPSSGVPATSSGAPAKPSGAPAKFGADGASSGAHGASSGAAGATTSAGGPDKSNSAKSNSGKSNSGKSGSGKSGVGNPAGVQGPGIGG